MAPDSTSPDLLPAREELLAARIKRGDVLAEEELIKTYHRAVLLIAGVRTHDRDLASDLSQEILIAVIKALRAGQIRDNEKLGPFIHGTARNIINNYLRSHARHPESALDPDEVMAPDPVEELELSERRRLMRQELAKYSAVDRRILLLSVVDGCSLAEVATRLHLTHDAVRARKSRLIRKIKKKFAGMSQP
ncbi:MAG TPA: sigma-70 family RNA polymerase sigma factor [Acidobacteriota bacterium]|jgi:RNA polymerase sigma factor (sigma-70 family)|nr:sigma-70 family RNA polymerase sigma factor [Acidobacteriota bacterium]